MKIYNVKCEKGISSFDSIYPDICCSPRPNADSALVYGHSAALCTHYTPLGVQ